MKVYIKNLLHQFLSLLKENFRLRLLWTANHKLDYVGLDISKDRTVETYMLAPLMAIHSRGGSVIEEVMKVDNKYAEIIPGEEIKFSFKSLSPPSDGYNRTFILKTTGRYIHIQK